MARTWWIRLALLGVVLGLMAGLNAAAGHASSVVAGAPAGIKAAGASGIQVVNLDSAETATVDLAFYRQGGVPPVHVAIPPLAPATGYNVYLPSEASLSSGAYSVLATADRQIAVLERTEWPASGGSALSPQAEVGTDIVVPAMKDWDDETTLISVQNTDTNARADVHIAFTAAGSDQPLLTSTYTVEPGGSITLDLMTDTAFAVLPTGFVGTARVTSTAPVAVMDLVDLATSAMAVYALNGRPASAAATSLAVPRIAAAAPVPEMPETIHNGRLLVINPSATASDVTVTYHGVAGACAGQTLVHGGHAFAIAAGSLAVFEPGPGGATQATGASGLPAGCIASAAVSASSPVTAAVVDLVQDLVTGEVVTAEAYQAFGTADAHSRQLLPLYRRQHTSLKLSTDVTVMNLGAAATTATLDITLVDGTTATAAVTLAPGEVHTWRPEDTTAPAGKYGSAIVSADQSLAVLVEDVSRNERYDAAAYEGMALDGPGTAASSAAIPLVLNARSIDRPPTATPVDGTPGPTATPGPTNVPPPSGSTWQLTGVGFVDVAGGTDPACPGCNGIIDQGDTDYAASHPLPPFNIIVRDDAGQVVTAGQSSQLNHYIQRLLLTVPPLAAGANYHVEVTAAPSGWSMCLAEQPVKLLHGQDFQLGNARVEWHFNTQVCTPTLPTATPNVPVAKMTGASGVQVVSLGEPGTVGAAAQCDLIAAADGTKVTVTTPPIVGGVGYNVYLPSEARLVNGVYAATISSAGPIGAVSRTEWSASGGAAMAEDAVPAANVVVPLVVKGNAGRNTIVSIQNFDAQAAADVSLTVRDGAGAGVASTTRHITAGSAVSIDIGRDPAFSELPVGFVGSLRAHAATRITAAAIVDVEHSPLAIYEFNGVPDVAAADMLFVPRVQSSVPVDPQQPAVGLNQTRIAVVNPGTDALDFALDYQGMSGTCASGSVSGANHHLAPGGMTEVDVSADGLPAGCVAAARVAATGAILGVAVDTVEAERQVRTGSAYNAYTAAETGQRVVLPLVRRQHTRAMLSTDIVVQNTGTAPADVTLAVTQMSGVPVDCAVGCSATLAPGAMQVFAPEAIPGMSTNSFGAGVVTSSQPLAVVVNDVSRLLMMDSAAYRGLVADGPEMPGSHALPVLLKAAAVRLPGPPIVPFEPGGGSPPDMTNPLAGIPGLPQIYLPAVQKP